MTKIGWVTNPDGSAGESLNCVFGCTKVSAGCKNCYAERMAKRLKSMGQSRYSDVISTFGNWNGKVFFDSEVLKKVDRWKKPRTIFLNSMSDTFHPGLDDVDIYQMLFSVFTHPRHIFILVTKRPDIARDRINAFCRTFNSGDPIPNLWLLVSVESQETADERIPRLLEANVIIGGLSMEPLLENVNLSKKYEDCSPLEYLRWVIVGFESGPGARVPGNAEDIAGNLLRQCKENDVPFYMKQLGGYPNKRDKLVDIPSSLHCREYPDVR